MEDSRRLQESVASLLVWRASVTRQCIYRRLTHDQRLLLVLLCAAHGRLADAVSSWNTGPSNVLLQVTCIPLSSVCVVTPD